MRTVLVCALVVACAAALAQGKTLWHQLDNYTFEDYKAEYAKTYTSAAEHEYRRKIFQSNLDRIRRHNAQPHLTWKEGVNHMTDWTVEEFKQLLGYRRTAPQLGAAAPLPAPAPVKDLPTSVDWRGKGVMTAVKDQGRCGSCWTFATAETLESRYALKTGKLPVVSEQHILDCTPNPNQCGGTGGCAGGTAELAYGTHKGVGLASEWTYPYTSYFGTNFDCKFNATTTPAVVPITGFVKLPANQEQPLLQALTEGPVAISVEAIHWSAYESGIFDGCNQTNPDIDHAVVAVGYGTENGNDYYIVRNSWSPEWGEDGFIRVRRTSNEDGRCGTDLSPGDGFGCKGGPSTMRVCGTCAILSDSCYPTVD